MNAQDQINQAMRVFLQRIDQGEDAQHLITLFAGSPQSPLALALNENAAYLAGHDVEVRVVFASADGDAKKQFIDALRAKFAAGAVSVRATSSRDYLGHNEQLVLGTTSYITGPTIAQRTRSGMADEVDVSSAEDEVAIATFAFDLLWDAAGPAVTSRHKSDGSASRLILSLVGFAELFGKLFHTLSKPLMRQQAS
jgi:hypothetical protein